MKTRLTAVAWAMAATLTSPLIAHAQTINTVSVVVAYTDDAKAWAEQQKVSCPQLLANPATAARLSTIRTLTNIQHVCELDPTLGRSTNHIDNLIKIAIAETNKVYKDSGINNINLVLADQVHVTGYKEGVAATTVSHPETMVSTLINDQGLRIAPELAGLRNRQDAGTNAELLNVVHTRRAAVQGDIVVLLTNGTYNNAMFDGKSLRASAGLAAGIGVDNPDEGFATLMADVATAPSFTFAHEVSHLFGANHDKVRVVGSGLINASQDVVAGTPHQVRVTVNGAGVNKISGWGYANPRYPIGNPASADYFDGYNDLMGYVACSETIVKDPVTQDERSAKCLGLPILSTLSPASGINRAIAYGDAGTSSTSAKLRDNASAVAAGAAKLAGFGERLSTSADPALAPNTTKIGIDFGEDPSYGWNYKVSPTDSTTITTAAYTKSYNLKTPADRNWNNITNREAGAAVDLIDQAGVKSRFQLAITQPFAARTATGLFAHDGKAPYTAQVLHAYGGGLDEMPLMAMADGFLSKKAQQGKIEIRGLNPSARYFFKIFGSMESGENLRIAQYDLKGAGGVVKSAKLATHGNILRFAKFSNVQPQANGVIEITVKPDASVPSSVSVPINAIEFYQQP